MAYYGFKPAEQAIQVGDNTIVSADIVDGVIVNADINASAAIALSKTQLVAGTGITLATNTLNVDAAQTQITSVGTIGTGVWQGTAVASAYLDADTAHLSTTQTFSGAKTFSSVVTADAGIDIDNFNIDGTTIGLSSGSMLLDAHTDIILDADSGTFRFKDDGTTVFQAAIDGNSFYLYTPREDGALVFKGNDGGSTVTALTLDMSAGGNATFAGNVLLMGADSYARDLTFRHGTANPNHYWRMGYTATGNGNTLAFINRDGGAEQEVMRMDYNKLTTFAGDIIADEITLNSDSHAYVHLNSSATSTATWIDFQQGGTGRWLAGVEGGETDFQLYASGATKFRLTTAGHVMLGNQTMTDHTNQTLGLRGTSQSGVSAITFLTTSSPTAGRSFAWASNYTAHGAFDLRCSENKDGTPFHTKLLSFGGNGDVDLNTQVYANNIGGDTFRNLNIRSDGRLGVDTSSKRYKKNIKDISDISWIYDLRPVDFEWKETNKKDWGLIAEEVLEVNPRIVGIENEVPEWVDYKKLIPILLKAVQELSAKVEALENA